MHGRPWSQSELKELVRLRKSGLSYREIAQRLWRTEIAVHSRLSLMAIHKPFAGRMAGHPMRDALCRPHTLEGVAKAFGKSRAAVVSIKHRLRDAGIEVYEIPRQPKRKEAA